LRLSDDDVASTLAESAGQRLLTLRGKGGDPAELRAAGDRQSHEFLTEQLAELRPGDAVLSEEGADDPGRLSSDRVWIIDPLDGTREFGEAGRTDWAVHVALWEAGDLVAGAVALPAQNVVLSTAAPAVSRLSTASGPGTRSGPGATSGPGRPLRLLASRSRPPSFLAGLADELGANLVPMGSAGAKAAAVIQGEADAYVHAGGQYEWDSAAPVAVARAAGLHASRIDGTELRYNRPDPYIADILICPVSLAATLLQAIERAQSATPPGAAHVPTGTH
jgi:3'(2'), 5'-bisphosphate nucleotidase